MKDPSVVIIGSGPGGFYAAESISKKLNSDIDIIDRLPTITTLGPFIILLI